MTGPSDLEGGVGTGTGGELLPRFGARVVDGLILMVVGVPLGLALDFGVAWSLIYTVVIFAYFVLFDVYYGTTLGKQLLGLKVTGPAGDKPTLEQAAIREAFLLPGVIPFIGGLLVLIAEIVIAVTINSSPTRQGKHDELAGGTQVVVAS